MCPVCLATIGFSVAGGVSVGGITAYLATRLLPGTKDEGYLKEGEKSNGKAPGRDT